MELSNFITCPGSSKCPLVQLRFTCLDIDTFSFFLKKTYVEFNEYPQYMFSSRNKKKYIPHNLNTILSYSYEVLVPGRVN